MKGAAPPCLNMKLQLACSGSSRQPLPRQLPSSTSRILRKSKQLMKRR